MKNLKISLLASLLFLTAGCHAQSNSNPTVFSCPVTTGSLYGALNQNTQTTALSYTDSKPTAGTYCYYAQSTIGAQISLASNTAGPFTTSGTNSVALAWNAPASGPSPTGYLISRAPAVSSTIVAPTITNGTLAEVKPALAQPSGATLAYGPKPLIITGKLE